MLSFSTIQHDRVARLQLSRSLADFVDHRGASCVSSACSGSSGTSRRFATTGGASAAGFRSVATVPSRPPDHVDHRALRLADHARRHVDERCGDGSERAPARGTLASLISPPSNRDSSRLIAKAEPGAAVLAAGAAVGLLN
jgi:hypothetical protein